MLKLVQSDKYYTYYTDMTKSRLPQSKSRNYIHIIIKTISIPSSLLTQNETKRFGDIQISILVKYKVQ